jgi:TPP-dependent pyruvate/acetoin dehydrogenase alpha subunit
VADGMDVMEVFEKSSEAISRVRKGEGPIFIECKTYRFVGHSALDPNDGMMYKNKEEEEQWRKKDPIRILREKLKKEGVTEEKFSRIEEDIKNELDKSVEFAEESEFPSQEEITEKLFSS